MEVLRLCVALQREVRSFESSSALPLLLGLGECLFDHCAFSVESWSLSRALFELLRG